MGPTFDADRHISMLLVLIFISSSLASMPAGAHVDAEPHAEWKADLRTLSDGGSTSIPLVLDLEDDGILDIVVTSGDSVYALTPDGTTKWRYTLNATVNGATAADLDGNGEANVIAVTEEGRVHCFNSKGIQLWTFDAKGPIKAVPALADLDKDGMMEIVFGDEGGDLIALDHDGNKRWEWSSGSTITTPPTIGDMDDDGILDVMVALNEAPRIAIIDGKGVPMATSELPSRVSQGMAMSNVDLTGGKEIVAATTGNDPKLVTLSANGTERWSLDLDGSPRAPILMDLDGDGQLEIIAGDGNGTVQMFEPSGEKGWTFVSSSRVVGLSGTNAPEPYILAVYEDGQVILLNKEGTREWEIDLDPMCDGYGQAITADVDNDLELEVLVKGDCGSLTLINTHQILDIPWSYSGKDVRNTRSMSALDDGATRFNVRWTANEKDIGFMIIAPFGGPAAQSIITFPDPTVRDGHVSVRDPSGAKIGDIALDGTVRTAPLAADLLEGPSDEIVIANDTSIGVWASDLGNRWEFPLEGTNYMAAADTSDDGKLEVFAGNQSGDIVALDPKDGSLLWNDDLGFGISHVAAADLDSNGEMDALFTTDNGILHVFNARNGTPLWASNILNGKPSDPVIADLDGDGLTDVAVVTKEGDVALYSGDGTERWSKTMVGQVNSAIAIPGEGSGSDLALATTTFPDIYEIVILNGTNGQVLQRHPHRSLSHLSAAPMGSQDPLDICFRSDTDIKFLAKDGEVAASLNAYGSHHAMVFGDLEEDGRLEMASANGTGITVWDLGVEYGTVIPWSMADHDAGRTNNPFTFKGGFLADLEVSSSDISFSPPLINAGGSVQVNISYHNRGVVAAGPFNISVREGINNITTIPIPFLGPFSAAITSFNWNVEYRNHTLDVTVDPDDQVVEIDETNDQAARPLYMNLQPLAKAGSDRTVDPNETVIFDGTGSFDNDGRIAGYEWDLGDGAVQDGIIVSHSYNRSGDFLVTLEVMDLLGSVGTDNVTIHVNYGPIFDDWTPRTDPTINEGEDIDFWVLAHDPDGDHVALEWFLDGIQVSNESLWSFWANYSSSGNHKVMVVAFDGNLSTNRTWDLKITDSIRLIESADPNSPVPIPQGQSMTFTITTSVAAEGAKNEWFLDGVRVQLGFNVFKLFAGEGTLGEYELMVQVSTDTGRDQHIWKVIVGPLEEVPRIRWVYPENGDVVTPQGSPVWFGLSSVGGSIQWLVDGGILMGENGPSFKFDSFSGQNHTVTVRVSSTSASVSHEWNVRVLKPPVALIRASALLIEKGGTVDLDGSGSHSDGNSSAITSYGWDFGDLGTGKGASVSHRFKEPGTYTVVLNVTDSNGLSSRVSVLVVVKADVKATSGFTALMAISGITIALISIGRRSGH